MDLTAFRPFSSLKAESGTFNISHLRTNIEIALEGTDLWKGQYIWSWLQDQGADLFKWKSVKTGILMTSCHWKSIWDFSNWGVEDRFKLPGGIFEAEKALRRERKKNGNTCYLRKEVYLQTLQLYQDDLFHWKESYSYAYKFLYVDYVYFTCIQVKVLLLLLLSLLLS